MPAGLNVLEAAWRELHSKSNRHSTSRSLKKKRKYLLKLKDKTYFKSTSTVKMPNSNFRSLNSKHSSTSNSTTTTSTTKTQRTTKRTPRTRLKTVTKTRSSKPLEVLV